MRHSVVPFVIVSTLAAATASAARQPSVPADLAREAEAYEHAQIEGNRAELERLLADDFVLVGGDGSKVGKREHINEFTNPNLKLEPVTVREPVVHVWPNGAALGGTVDLKGTFEGKPFAQTLRYVDVWARREARWVVVYGQATRVPPPAGG